jgi:type I restriction enzyme S subunit
MAVTGIPMYTNEAIAALVIKDNKRVRRDYLKYALMTITHDKSADGAVLGLVLNKKKDEAIQVPLPPLAEQDRLLALLDEADALRKLRAQAETRTAQLIPAIFQEMFGDPAVNEHRLPKKSVRELSTRISDGPFGSNLKSSHYSDTGIRVIRLQNVGIGELKDDEKSYVPVEHFEKLMKHECLPGDVMIGTLGDPNLRAFVMPSFIDRAMNKSDVVQLRVNPDIAIPEYVCWLMNMPGTLRLASGLVMGQTRDRISMGRLSSLEVPVPSLAQQHEFAARVSEVRALQAAQGAAWGKVEALWGSLLGEVFG